MSAHPSVHPCGRACSDLRVIYRLGMVGGQERGVTGEGPGRVAVKVPDVTVTTSRNNLIPQLGPSSADLLLQGH